jgi:periplasmic divalent cation tolerance protein
MGHGWMQIVLCFDGFKIRIYPIGAALGRVYFFNPLTLKPMSLIFVLTSVQTQAQAQSLSSALVREGWVACAQFHAIQSTYVWQEALVQEEEFRLLFKSTTELMPELERRMKELHPYELPAFVAFEPSACSEPFLNWVTEQTRSPKPAL